MGIAHMVIIFILKCYLDCPAHSTRMGGGAVSAAFMDEAGDYARGRSIWPS
ncbi:hypothetical protein BLIG_01655 [Bifidobacterium longum subsp. infantis CCUG 52486]|uniref:Uncharacterized protein n=1 Tax=Bifidobacterium longum subsp. infantis CCUG 52486 TaxID=537937 RepID=C5EBD7_BIFLI|nr:hypothetical protein BLIG_01655 [Bifidobacterium longum subsp. infantis CCUG 52486]